MWYDVIPWPMFSGRPASVVFAANFHVKFAFRMSPTGSVLSSALNVRFVLFATYAR